MDFIKIAKILLFSIIAALSYQFGYSQSERPNVILVLTDDQGIGDLGCHGNPWLKTPNLDAFYRESVRMTDFHVSPVCTPTRGAIITGRYPPISNGAWTLTRVAMPFRKEPPPLPNYSSKMAIKRECSVSGI